MDSKYKLVMAILQEDDYESTVEELNQHEIFVTKLSSTGGFFKKKNITVMIGVETEKLEQVLQILKAHSGRRRETVYMMPTPVAGAHCMASETPVPVAMDVGGVTVFVLNMDQLEKY